MNVIVSTDSTNTNLATTIVATVPFTERRFISALGLDFIRNRGTVLYSADGITWTQLGSQFNLAYDWANGNIPRRAICDILLQPATRRGLPRRGLVQIHATCIH